MGGRGARSSGGSAATGELILPNGSKIEFEGALHYDGDDSAVSGAARAAITAWEARRVKNKVEYAYSLDANGNPIGREVRGGQGSVHVPYDFHDTPDAVFSHVHPRGDGMLGGTFSGDDLSNFANYRNKTVRATAKEGTYSISKGKKFDAVGFKQYVAKCEGEFDRTYKSKSNALRKEYRAGSISYYDYLIGAAKAFNTALVKLHSDYRAGQKQYGYSYTLEKTN